MDTFMDKLAQKLNAQEMIRANSAAEAEELGKLKNQVAEYHECLTKLQGVLDTGARKLEGVQVNDAEVKTILTDLKDSLTAALKEQDASVEAKLEEQKTQLAAALTEQKTAVVAKLDENNENVHKECVKVYRNVQAVVVEENGKQTETLVNSVAALKGKLNAVLGVSITAMILALAGVVLQVLNLLNLKLL